MPHIAIAGMPALGHLNPTVPFVRELSRRGVEITYYTDERFRPVVEAAGARWYAYPPGTICAQDIAEATRVGGPLGVVGRVLSAAEAMVPFLIEQFRGGVDAVAFDSNALWGRIAASTLDLPTISLMTTIMLGPADYRRMTGGEWMALLPALRGLPGVVAARRRLVRRFGTRVFPPPPALPLRGDVTIFPIPRQMQPSHPLIDESCHFVGPTIDTGRAVDPLDAELAAHLDTAEPVVLVSLGTLHAGTEAFFRGCFEALAGLPVRAVIAIGSRTDLDHLGTPPQNVVVRRSVPQIAVLARANAFITHGGMNSVLEALSYKVPMVVVPQQVEQLAIGSTVADRGAAIVLRHHLSHRPVPPAQLRQALGRVLADAHLRRSAETIRGELFTGGGAVAAADAIQTLLDGHR